MDAVKVKQLFSQMDESEQEDFVNNLSDEDATSLMGALKQPEQQQSEQAAPTTQQIQQNVRSRFFGALEPEIGSEAFLVGFGEPFVKTGQRIQQLFSSPGKAAQIGENAAYDERLRQAQLAKEPPAFQFARGLGKFAGIMAPALAVPGPGAVGITSALGRIGYGAGAGGAFGLTSGEPVQNKSQFIGQGLIGAGMGGGLQSGIEALSYVPRKMASLFTAADEAKQSSGILRANPVFEQGRKTEQLTGVKLTPGQLTGSSSLSEMKPPQEFTNQQAKSTLRYFTTLKNRISGIKNPSPQLASNFNQVTNQSLDKLVATRRDVGNFYFNKFKGSVKEVQADGLMSKMDEIAKDAVPGTDEGIVINLRDKLFKQLDESGGSLTTEQFLGWKQRIDDLLSGKSDIFKNLKSANQRRIGAQLSDALWSDVGKTADMLEKTGAQSPAKLLRLAQQKYTQYSQPIDELRDSALGALFKSGEKFNPDTIGQKLMSLQPSEVGSMYGVLEKYYPQGLQQYQSSRLYDAMKKSVAIAPGADRAAGATKFDPRAVMNALTKNGSLRPIFDKDPQLMRDINRGLALLDRVSDRINIGSGGVISAASTAKQAAQIAASQNPIFSAGFFAQHLGPTGLWKLTSTDGGRQLLKTLASTPLQGPRFEAAVTELTNNYLNEEDQ